MLNKNFFDSIRTSLFNQLSTDQVQNLNFIFDAWKEVDDKDIRLLSYSLAIAYHEVGPNLTPVSENLNYSAQRMTEVWPSRFKTLEAAKPFANNPEKLANKVYGGRLGNDKEGDGWRYRGRGYSQITGKVSYDKFAKLLNLDLVGNPDLALQQKVAAKILIMGIRDGLFTGKKFSDYTSYEKARPTVNADSTRKTQGGKSTISKDIAGYANKFEKALENGISEGVAVVVQPSTSTPVAIPTTVNNQNSALGKLIGLLIALAGVLAAAAAKLFGVA